MNSTVEPIFNEKVAEKWSLWIPYIVHGTHWCALCTEEKSKITAQKKKKKREKRENADVGSAKHTSQTHSKLANTKGLATVLEVTLYNLQIEKKL